MKKLNILILSALTAVSGSAMAMGFTVEQGKTLPTLIWNWVNPPPVFMPKVTGSKIPTMVPDRRRWRRL
jgi:hypothetical protein